MDSNILWQLLKSRGLTGKIEVLGESVIFFDPEKNNKPFDAPNESPYDTPENRAIVADVIKNYDKLAPAQEQADKDAIEKEALISAKMREQAITALQVEGKLTTEGKVAVKE